MTLRVLFLSDYAAQGGGETSLLHLMEALRQRDVEPILHVPAAGPLTANAEGKGLTTEINPISRWKKAWLRDIPLYDPRGATVIENIIDQYDVDLIHCNSPEHSLVHGAIAARRRALPFVWTCHGPWERPCGLRGRLLAPYLGALTCVSEWVASQANIPGIIPRVIYPGIPGDYLSMERHTGREQREQKEQGEQKVVALIGRFQRIKGHQLFVEAALSLINDNHEDLVFMLVGGAEFDASETRHFEHVQQMIESSGKKDRFVITGSSEDMPGVYAGIDLLVVASEAESFSMVTVEAMAAGITPVVMDISAPREITADNEFGYTYRTGDSASLATTILKGLSEPKSPASLKDRAKQFSSANTADEVAAIYRQLCASSSGNRP